MVLKSNIYQWSMMYAPLFVIKLELFTLLKKRWTTARRAS